LSEITGPGVTDMLQLSLKLRAADPKLRRELYKNLKGASQPVVRRVQDSIRSMPAHTERGLREEVARTVYAAVSNRKSGVQLSIVSAARRMPQGKESLPAHLDSARGWAHPVYAGGSRFRLGPSRARKYKRLRPSKVPLVHLGQWTWVRQLGKPQWFEQPIINSYRDLRAAAQRALDETARDLAR
jgi:hypothetical protein